MKPFSAACERNREPILEVLRGVFTEPMTVLEIGSGTGQHAVYFGAHLPDVRWQTSDRNEHHPGVQLWLDEAGLKNVLPPLSLDVSKQPWPIADVDAVFSANTTHIMSWPEVERMFEGVGDLLKVGRPFCLYGPFNKNGEFTSASNQAFDADLKSRDPQMGVRDIGDLEVLAEKNGMVVEDDVEMPANNRILIWRRQ